MTVMAEKKGRKNPISISHMCASATKEMANSKAAALDSHGMEEDGTAQPWVVNSFPPSFLSRETRAGNFCASCNYRRRRHLPLFFSCFVRGIFMNETPLNSPTIS